jgi:hypothetical protein
LKLGIALCSLSSRRSAIAIIAMPVFFDIDDITAVPLPPHPIMPIRIAEFAFEPKTVPGFRMVNAEIAVAFFKKDLRSIFFIIFGFS